MGRKQQVFTRKMSQYLARNMQRREDYIVYIYYIEYLSNLGYRVIDIKLAKEFQRELEKRVSGFEVLTSEYFNEVYKGKKTLASMGDYLYKYINKLIHQMELKIIYKDVYVSVQEYKNHEVFEDSLSVDFYQRVREEGNVMYLVKLYSESYGNKYKEGVYTTVGDTYTPDKLRRMPKDNLTKVYKNKDGTYTVVIGKDKEGKEVKYSLNLKRYKGESYKETSKNKKWLKPPIN